MFWDADRVAQSGTRTSKYYAMQMLVNTNMSDK